MNEPTIPKSALDEGRNHARYLRSGQIQLLRRALQDTNIRLLAERLGVSIKAAGEGRELSKQDQIDIKDFTETIAANDALAAYLLLGEKP